MTLKKKDLSIHNEEDIPDAKSLSFGIVVSNWNPNITKSLFKGAYDTLIKYGAIADKIQTYEVPGSFELIYGAKVASRNNPDVIICIGSVIQGETKHFDFVCSAVANGIKDLNIKLNIPVIFGVLTDNTMYQAISRSGGKYGNKGVEAAITAIKMAVLSK
jgi:6,7-dimethyl-8-ribityllumazine synthase